jgi:NAD(P)-dependent dehydrogenase (short-subunit alcohol dehydrogenase family)
MAKAAAAPPPEDTEHACADRMRDAGQARGDERVEATKDACLKHPGGDLGRTDHHAGEYGRRRRRAAIALGDLLTEAGKAAVIDATGRAFGGVDILVNNAGGSTSRSRSISASAKSR